MNYCVSVIVPVYNVEDLLPKCVDSLINQSLNEIQIILVDDGSTDRSSEIAKAYSQQYENVEYYYKKNGGSSSARNVGLDHACGEYIGFVDSDDWVEPNMYELLYHTATAHNNTDIVFCRAFENETPGSKDYIFPRGGFYDRKQMEHEIFPYILPCLNDGVIKSIRWSNPLHLYKRSVIENCGIRYFEGSRRCEDLAFNFECTIRAQSYYYVDDICLYHNYANPKSKTRSYTKNMWTSIGALMKYMKDVVDEYSDYDFKAQNEFSTFKFCVDCVWNELKATDKKESYRQLKTMMCDPLCAEIVKKPIAPGLIKSDKLIWKTLRTKSPSIVINALKARQKKTRVKKRIYNFLHSKNEYAY